MMGWFKHYQKNVNNQAAKRIKTSNEVINNMKFLKVNALQQTFLEKLNDLRLEEVGFLKKYLNLGIIAIVFQSGASRIATIIFILLNHVQGHSIHTTLVFSVLLFFNFMALHKIVNKANSLEDVNISITKIEDYLRRKEKDSSYIVHFP